MIPYIKVNQLNMDKFPSSEITFTVSKNEFVGITGANGCGKSTLAMYLAGMKRPDKLGQIIIAGLDPFSQLDSEKLLKKTGIVCQNVGRDIIFGAENQGIESEKIKNRAAFYMKKYDLPKKSGRSFSNLSASEQQRVALCSILIMHPDILILDEAFSMQGRGSAKEYLKQVIKSARKNEQTVIVFSKDRNLLSVTDRIYELSDGRIRELVSENDSYNNEENSYHEEASYHDRSSHHDKSSMDTASKNTDRSLKIEKIISGGVGTVSSGISLHNVSFGYDDKLFIDRKSVKFEAGSAYRITGAPGAGKSTLLQIIGGMLKPYEGEIFKSDNSRVGYVFQYPEEAFVSDTVIDDVMFGPLSDGYARSEARKMSEQVLKFVGLGEEYWSRSPLKLSAGEQKLVALSGALALNPDILLLDEPFAGLDEDGIEHIRLIIEGLCSEGKCIIITET